MRHGFLRSSRYSPGNMDRESLEALFVGRSDVMDDVLSRVTTSIRSPEKHYILLVGPRGSGKTHFLALAHHRLMDRFAAAGPRDGVAVAMLNEEEWGVASFLDLVVRILRALADQAPDLHAEIAAIYDGFSKDPADAEGFAVERLREHTRGKTLLLLCENLVDLFHGLGEEGQKRWRALIQEDGNWTIVASTPSLFAAVTLQDNPFYGFFTVRQLTKIDLDTGIELLARKAVHEGKMDLAQFLRKPLGRARARAIHHLAAGNHRAYVVLFDFLDKESLEDLVDPFMHMVDDLTPYYQDRMRQLPPAQRKIVEFLSLEGKPTTIKEISTPCLMSHQTAAKQIGDLETAGFVNRMRSGRNTFCELSEPLMRICIEVKDNKTRHFRLFVEFLRHWFTPRELERRHAAFDNDDLASCLDRIHVEEAVRCFLSDKRQPLVEALHAEAERCRDSGDYRGWAAIQETLVQDGGRAEDYCTWVYALVSAGDVQSAIAAGREAAEKYPDDATVHYYLAHAYFLEDHFVEALSAIDRAIALDGKVPAYLYIRAGVLLGLALFDDAIESAQAVLDTDPEHWQSLVLIVSALVSQGRVGDAEAHVKDLVRIAPEEPGALLTTSGFYLSQNRLTQALEFVDKLLDIYADHQEAHHLRGLVLFKMGDYRRASEDLRQFVSHNPRSVSAHRVLAGSLVFSGGWPEAIEVAEHLIEIDPAGFHGHTVRGTALCALDRPEDAVAAFDELLPGSERRSLLLAAEWVREIGDYASAGRYLDRVAELQPDNRELWIERTRLHIDEDTFDAAAESAARLEALPGGSLLGRLLAAQAAAASKPLSVALDKLGANLEREEFESDEPQHREAIVGVLTVSVGSFGPRYLSEGLVKLQGLLKEQLDEGVVGRTLTDFLKANIDDGFAGSLADWEAALESLTASLADLPDCRIPLEMLQAAVRYTKTDDEKQLLSLPLEQRQLLEDILPSAAGERAGRG